MIFKSGYRRLTAEKQIKSGGLTLPLSLIWSLVSTILTLAVYFGMLLLAQNEAEGVHTPFHTSFFGILYIYTVVNFAVVFILMLVCVNFSLFSEILTNRWNLLTSMGIPISGLVGCKISVSIAVLIRQYLIGFIFVIGCGFLFGMPFAINYLIALFLAGSAALVLMVMLSMAMTVFAKRSGAARVCLFFAFFAVQTLLIITEFYHRDMFRAEVFVSMFSPRVPSFLTISAIVCVVCYTVILFVARERSRHHELMPLGVFDIKPLVSGGETELFMTEGMKHTTIIDAGLLRERELTEIVEKPEMLSLERKNASASERKRSRLPYRLFAALSVIALIISAALLFMSILMEPLRPYLEELIGEGLSASLVTDGGRIALAATTAGFTVLIVVFIVLRKRNLP